MAQPGTLDFAKLAKEATTALNKESAAPKQVKIAATEGGIPAPQHAVVDDTRGDDWNDDNQVGEPEVETQEESATNVELTEQPSVTRAADTDKTQDQLEEEIKELPDDHKVRVKIDGEVQVITHGEYKDIIRKNATVTQRMQAFAKSRAEFEDAVQETLRQLQAREQALQQVQPKSDPLSEALIAALKGQVAPKPRDPNEIVTLGDVQAQREQMLAELQQARQSDRAEFERALALAAQNVQQSAQATRERQEYLNGLDGILKKDQFQVLNEVIPNLQANVMFHVQSLKPNNLAEALEYSEDYIKERYKAFAKHTTAAQQKQQAKAAKQKMEPNDGATPTVVKSTSSAKKNFVGKNGKLDWKAMSADALARANSMA